MTGALEVALGHPPNIAVPGNRWDLLDGIAPAELASVSVIVPHYRQQAELDRTLAALARQTYPTELVEVIVVDDGSPEPPRVATSVKLLTQPDRGFRVSAARNLGVRHAAGDLLCFLDADSSPEPRYLEELTRLPSLAPDVVTVATRRHADFTGVPPSVPVEQAGPAHELPMPAWLTDEYVRTADLLTADDRSYRFVIGAVLCCRRSFFDIVGGFDETFTHYGGEDWEWASRAWSHGAVFAHEGRAVAWHDGPEWSTRVRSHAERIARKNVETLRLARSVAATGSGPAALRIGAPQVAVRLGGADSMAALVVGVDQLLQALPGATVIVPLAVHVESDSRLASVYEVFAGDERVVARDAAQPIIHLAGVIVDVPVPVRGLASHLESAVQRLSRDDLGSIDVIDPVGATLATVTSTRAVRREARWALTLFSHETMVVTDALQIMGEPDLEAYFGGWDGEPSE
ncbi:glycosyltransferase [Subtercola lobariae]|uniref:Glycosyltransferase n=1 Tax=Subtercola lobariae TaxID=1588641 RepID=A0A917BID5_9MICO|nr:glycosyltransferase [Subtercola lobariae]GGF41386.1 hypothetical protein GCM10011399_37570 [Subtercola lobariae]